MKVLHIVGGGLSGGAARGAYWLHQGLRQIGINSRLFVQKSGIKDENIVSLSGSRKGNFQQILLSALDQIPTWFYKNRNKKFYSAGICGYNPVKTQEYKEADLIHLHWINNGMLSIFQIGKMQKPVVWTMRDMWPMTGGCHYAMDCKKYETTCGFCDQLNSKKHHDLSYYILKAKLTNFPKHIKIVGISHWLSECAKQSSLFRNFDISTIFNNINTDEFVPIDKYIARNILGLPDKKKIILTGAQNLDDFHKGFPNYLKAIQLLNNKTDKYLLFFGKLDENIVMKSGFEYKSFGFLEDSISLRLVYSASDVFVAPTLIDAFGKTLAEAMACGTPVVSFDVAGPKDIVDHKINGYKASPYMAEELAAGIEWVLFDESRHKRLCANAREKSVGSFSSDSIANQYLALYQSILPNV